MLSQKRFHELGKPSGSTWEVFQIEPWVVIYGQTSAKNPIITIVQDVETGYVLNVHVSYDSDRTRGFVCAIEQSLGYNGSLPNLQAHDERQRFGLPHVLHVVGEKVPQDLSHNLQPLCDSFQIDLSVHKSTTKQYLLLTQQVERLVRYVNSARKVTDGMTGLQQRCLDDRHFEALVKTYFMDILSEVHDPHVGGVPRQLWEAQVSKARPSDLVDGHQ